MMNVPVQFQYSPNSQPAAPAGYWKPGMSASELNTAARKDREAGKRVLDEHERKLDALLAETRQLTASKWGTDHHGGVPKPRLIGFRAKHGHLFGDAPTASKTPRREPPRSLASRAALAKVRLHEARIAEREASAASRRADDALAKSLEPPPKVWLLDVEPCRYVGGEVHEIEQTWGDGDRIWTTRTLTVFGEQALMEGRYP